jgi:hypothetical protein
VKLHTSLTENEIRACLDRAKADDLPDDIVFDVFGTLRSRYWPRAFEIHLATARKDTRADSVTRKTSSLAGGGGLRYAATYDEWGSFLAEFFEADPQAKAGPYKGGIDFHIKTEYAYALGMDEMPADTAQEIDHHGRVAEYASTEPTTDAKLPVIQRIDDTLAGYWTGRQHP